MDLPLEIVAAVGEAQCLGEDILIVCCNRNVAQRLFSDIVHSYDLAKKSFLNITFSSIKGMMVDFDKGSLKICSATEDPMYYRGGIFKIRFANQWDSFIDKRRKEEWMRARYLYSKES